MLVKDSSVVEVFYNIRIKRGDPYEYAKEHALTPDCVNYLLLLRLRRRGISLRWVSSPSGRVTRWGRGARSLS